jgi:hypothetical protein
MKKGGQWHRFVTCAVRRLQTGATIFQSSGVPEEFSYLTRIPRINSDQHGSDDPTLRENQ